MKLWRVWITYRDLFIVRAETAADVRRALATDFERFGARFERVQIEPPGEHDRPELEARIDGSLVALIDHDDLRRMPP